MVVLIMSKEKYVFKRSFGLPLLEIILGIVLTLLFPFNWMREALHDQSYLIALIAGICVFFLAFLILVELTNLFRYDKYYKIFQKHEINTISDIALITGYSVDDISRHFSILVKRKYISTEIYDMVPSLKKGYNPNNEDNHDTAHSNIAVDESNNNPGFKDNTPAHNNGNTVVEELDKLAKLHTEGFITNEEFQDAKRRLLNNPTNDNENSIAEELSKLVTLHKEGHITVEEFQEAKKRLSSQ